MTYNLFEKSRPPAAPRKTTRPYLHYSARRILQDTLYEKL